MKYYYREVLHADERIGLAGQEFNPGQEWKLVSKM